MRVTTLTIAAAIAAIAVSPAFAAKHKRQAAPVESGYSDTNAARTAPVAARPGLPPVVNDQPLACFTDEGYGRFASCDQAGY